MLARSALPAIIAEVAFYATSCTGIAFMALYHGGLTSPYMHGVSNVLLVHATLITSSWRRALAVGLLLA